MILVVGLGNPGAEYEKTRHNIGFWALDRLAERYGISLTKKDASFLYGKGRILSEEAVLLKPTTYMNESGLAVKRAMTKIASEPLDLSHVHIFHDEVDLPLGRLKIKQGGGDAGHKGLLSITKHIGSDYIRYRMGVGRPGVGGKNIADHVLDTFRKGEIPLARALADWTCDALVGVLEQGLTPTQNQFHTLEKPPGF